MNKVISKFKIVSYFSAMLSLIMLSSCGNVTYGTLYSLGFLFENGYISEDNLKNVAALRNGSLQKVVGFNDDYSPQLETIEYEVVPVSDELSEEQSKKILNDFNNYINDTFKNSSAKINSSKVIEYYGTYEGYSVVEIQYSVTNYNLSGSTSSLSIYDYYFGTLNSDCGIIAWIPNSQ